MASLPYIPATTSFSFALASSQGHISWYVVQWSQSFQHQILLPKMQLASGQFLAHSQWSTIATMWDAVSSVCTAQSPQLCVPELDGSSRCLQQLLLQPPALLLSHHASVTSRLSPLLPTALSAEAGPSILNLYLDITNVMR